MSASFDRERIPQRQLGELMTELGMITEEQLATVLELQRQSNQPLGQIIVERGFASGAAVAHALAMQSGGALKTEHGFALGVGPVDHPLDDESHSRADIPKLRLAPSAVRPVARRRLAAAADPSAGTPRDAAAPAEKHVALAVVPAAEPDPEQQTNDEPLPTPSVPTDAAPALEPAPEEGTDAPTIEKLEHLEAALERLEDALAEAQTREQDAVRLREERDRTTAELERLRADVERLEAELAEARRSDEEELRRAEEERDRVTADLEHLHAAQADAQAVHEEELRRAQEERDRVIADLEHLQAAQADAQAAHEEELNRLQEERDRATAELDRVRSMLDGLSEVADEPLPTLDPSADEREATDEAAADIVPRTETAHPDDEPRVRREILEQDIRQEAGGAQHGSARTVDQYHAALRHTYQQAGLAEPAPPSLAEVRRKRDPATDHPGTA